MPNHPITAIVSGGMDSVTLAHLLQSHANLARIVSFDYGQRHAGRELACAHACATRLGVPWHKIGLADVATALRPGSALTDTSRAIPHGHYTEQSMKQTVVPNRNAIMLAIAFGIAAAHGDKAVGAAVHAGDHYIYPDCRPEFVAAFRSMEALALSGLWSVDLVTPFITDTKAGIARTGFELGVPFEETWSCYEGGAVHCGRCGTCVERREAFFIAGIDDPTPYEDMSDFWKEECVRKGSLRLAPQRGNPLGGAKASP